MSSMGTILVVDDAAIFREPVTKWLQLKGYTVHCATNGIEALAALRQHELDLVLLDLAMPEMDGPTFLKIIRQEPQWKDLPVIVLTARSDLAALTQDRELGVKEVLLKSRFSLTVLLGYIQRHIRRRPIETAAERKAMAAAR